MGEYQNVQNAIFEVTTRLRNHLLSVGRQNEMRSNDTHERGKQLPAPGEHQLTRLNRGNESEATMSQVMDYINMSFQHNINILFSLVHFFFFQRIVAIRPPFTDILWL